MIEIRTFFKEDPILHFSKLLFESKQFKKKKEKDSRIHFRLEKSFHRIRLKIIDRAKENLCHLDEFVKRHTIRQFWQDVDPLRETVRNALSGWRVQVYRTCIVCVCVRVRVFNRLSIRLYERAAPPAVSLPSSRRTFVSYKTPGKLTSGHLPRPLYPSMVWCTCARSTKECRILESFGEIHEWIRETDSFSNQEVGFWFLLFLNYIMKGGETKNFVGRKESEEILRGN